MSLVPLNSSIPVILSNVETRTRVQDSDYWTSGDLETKRNIALQITKEGYRNTDWRDLIKRGQDASTPYTRVKPAYVRKGGGQWTADRRFEYININEKHWYHDTWTGPTEGFQSLCANGITQLDSIAESVLPDVSSAYTKAANNFYTNVGNVQMSMPMLALGLKSNLGLFVHPLKRWSSSIEEYLLAATKLRKRFKTSSGRVLKMLSENWLEYCYGWRLLFQDIDDVYKVITEEPFRSQRVDGYGKVEELLLHDSTPHMYSNWAYRTDHIQRRVISVKMQAEFVAQAVAPSNYYTAKDLGYSLESFVPTVWDLLPYSFVIDYFTSLGSFLSAIWYVRVPLKFGVTDHKLRFIEEFRHTCEPGRADFDYSNQYTVNTLKTHGASLQEKITYEKFIRKVGLIYMPGVVWKIPSMFQISEILALLPKMVTR